MLNLGTASATITLNNAGFLSGLDQAERALDRLGAAGRRVQEATTGVPGALRDVASAARDAGRAFGEGVDPAFRFAAGVKELGRVARETAPAVHDLASVARDVIRAFGEGIDPTFRFAGGVRELGSVARETAPAVRDLADAMDRVNDAYKNGVDSRKSDGSFIPEDLNIVDIATIVGGLAGVAALLIALTGFTISVPALLIILGVALAVGLAIYAWQTNLWGFRDGLKEVWYWVNKVWDVIAYYYTAIWETLEFFYKLSQGEWDPPQWTLDLLEWGGDKIDAPGWVESLLRWAGVWGEPEKKSSNMTPSSSSDMEPGGPSNQGSGQQTRTQQAPHGSPDTQVPVDEGQGPVDPNSATVMVQTDPDTGEKTYILIDESGQKMREISEEDYQNYYVNGVAAPGNQNKYLGRDVNSGDYGILHPDGSVTWLQDKELAQQQLPNDVIPDYENEPQGNTGKQQFGDMDGLKLRGTLSTLAGLLGKRDAGASDFGSLMDKAKRGGADPFTNLGRSRSPQPFANLRTDGAETGLDRLKQAYNSTQLDATKSLQGITQSNNMETSRWPASWRTSADEIKSRNLDMTSNVMTNLQRMQTGGGTALSTMTTFNRSQFAGMNADGVGSASAMATGVGGQLGAMQLGQATSLAAMAATNTSQFSLMNSTGTANATTMSANVGAQTSGMGSTHGLALMGMAVSTAVQFAAMSGTVGTQSGTWPGLIGAHTGSARTAGFGVGAAAGQGVAAGLASARGAIAAQAASIIAIIKAVMEAKAMISSPSKMTAKIGKQITQGVAVGLGDPKYIRGVVYKSKTVIGKVKDAMESAKPAEVAEPELVKKMFRFQKLSGDGRFLEEFYKEIKVPKNARFPEDPVANQPNTGSTSGGGTTTIINQHTTTTNNNQTTNALKSDELVKVIDGAEKGRNTHAAVRNGQTVSRAVSGRKAPVRSA